MNKYKLYYGNNISEEIYAENEDDACDNSNYPESNIINVQEIGSKQMNKPSYMHIINDGDIFRLRYNIDGLRVTSKGFKNKKEMLKVLKEDDIFKLEMGQN